MPISIKALHQRSESARDQLKKKLEAETKKGYEDDRFFYPKRDDAGNGKAIIRFLPAAAEDHTKENPDPLPYVKIFKHTYQDPNTGRWVFENCPTTLGADHSCPICEANRDAWNSGDQATARKRKRQLDYIANVLVVSDPATPDNEGKVFLFRFGKKIMDKIHEVANPEFEDENAVNVFDFWEGANFRLNIRKVEGMTNYDKSKFETVSALFNGKEAKLKETWEACVSLTEFIDPAKFKNYSELKQLFLKASSGQSVSNITDDISAEDNDISVEDDDTLAEFEGILNEDEDAIEVKENKKDDLPF